MSGWPDISWPAGRIGAARHTMRERLLRDGGYALSALPLAIPSFAIAVAEASCEKVAPPKP